MYLFYTPDIAGNTYQLSDDEAAHCVRVLRLKVGDILHLTDGRGTLFTARVADNNPKHCLVNIEQVQHDYQPCGYYLHLAVAFTKNIDRYEWMLEKITEIGVDEITPLLCEHSERRIWKKERAEKILVSAMKQSLKTRLPKLNDPCGMHAFVHQPFDGTKLIAHCDEGMRNNMKEAIRNTARIQVLIGPEGDFSPEEIEMALRNGYMPVTLGESRLRTETAGMMACAAVYIAHEF